MKVTITRLMMLIVSSLIIPFYLNAQHIFPKKLNNCITTHFCMDCGDIKATVDERKLGKMLKKLAGNSKGINGKILFQILVDSTGKGCVLSHTDVSVHIISKNITNALNEFDGFIPAQSQGKIESRTSFNMAFEIKHGEITAKVERIDMVAFMKGFDKPRKPEIFNTDYVYKNESLSSYRITVWNSQNSNLPNNMTDNMTIDKNGNIWLTIDDGLVQFDGKQFRRTEQTITDKRKYFPYYYIESDNENVKWVYAKSNVYSYDGKDWKIYTPEEIGVDKVYEIVNNPRTSELFICSEKGLSIYKNGSWSNLNKNKVNELPSDRVAYAKRDSRNRIWIGTFNGTVMIDENGKATSFENSNTVLKGKCITSMDEDDEGNLYFSLFELERKNTGQVNKDEGIAIWYKDGTVKQFTTANSGLPFNHTNCVLFDRKEKVLWISTDRAGLVRYDLKNNWENYHSDNSEIPTSYISTMRFDKNGILYLATRQGLVRIEKR